MSCYISDVHDLVKCIKTDHELGESSSVSSGVRQGGVLSPLFESQLIFVKVMAQNGILN